jgi:hypothetical protein
VRDADDFLVRKVIERHGLLPMLAAILTRKRPAHCRAFPGAPKRWQHGKALATHRLNKKTPEKVTRLRSFYMCIIERNVKKLPEPTSS